MSVDVQVQELSVLVSPSVCMYTHQCVCECVGMCVCMYVCMCVCVCVLCSCTSVEESVHCMANNFLGMSSLALGTG